MKLTDDGQDVLFKMSPRLHYIVTALWALVTPALTSIVAKMFVEDNAVTDPKELSHPGAPALEYFSMFLVFGACFFLLFVIYNLICSIFFLPEDEEKSRCFFLALALYCLVCIACLTMLMLLEAWIADSFA